MLPASTIRYGLRTVRLSPRHAVKVKDLLTLLAIAALMYGAGHFHRYAESCRTGAMQATAAMHTAANNDSFSE